MKRLFTSESVGKGHPDKLADQISDAILDACLRGDSGSHVGCETFLTTGLAMIGGEITTQSDIDINAIVRDVVKSVGYDRSSFGLDYNSMAVLNVIDPQSSDISEGIRNISDPERVGAGDQGIMFGYACNESPNYMPLAISLAHQIVEQADRIRTEGNIDILGPDSKSQVTIEYKADKPVRIDTIVVSQQHSQDTTLSALHDIVLQQIIKPVLSNAPIASDSQTKYIINPAGSFVLGGPHADTGLTGRKIIIDTYGGFARHGGGAFSGKDPSKVDRSAAYLARKAARTVVAAGLSDQCEIQLSYAIGIEHPISISLFTFGTEKYNISAIEQALLSVFDFTPAGIIRELDLLKPIYQATACFGHFGRDRFSWETVDKVDALLSALK